MTRIDAIVVAAVMIVSALCVGLLLRIGWVPSDEGTLAQSALRVYQGQLPHRDFAEIYTGGLSFLHAIAFRFFGVNLFSLRISVFLVFLAWIPAVYYIARRFLSPVWSGIISLTAVSWSYPNYVAAMPSWYNLFLATFGAAALLRYLEVRSRRWLFLAGVCGGASVLVKVVGLYYVAAVLMFLLFLEQERHERGVGVRRGRLYSVVCILSLVAYLAVLTRVILPQLHSAEVYHFLLPSALCVGLLVWREYGTAAISNRQRFAGLFSLAFPFLSGFAIVIAIFLFPYVASGSCRLFFDGVIGSTGARMAGLAGRQHPPGIIDLADYGIVILVLIVIALYAEVSRKWAVVALVATVLTGVLVYSAFASQLQDPWMMAGTFTPLAVLLGSAMIFLGPRWGTDNKLAQQRIMLLISLAAVCSLVQYPVPYVTYFCYTAPLTLLAVVASVSIRQNPPGRLLLATLVLFFLGFGWLAMVTKHIYDPDLKMGALHRLELPRAGGVKVDDATRHYEELIPFLQAHSPNGLMYAGNDCPELYFLSGLKNPTRDDTGAPAGDVLNALRSGKLQLVAINDESFFLSGSASPVFRAAVKSFLPNTEKIGRFSIYWR